MSDNFNSKSQSPVNQPKNASKRPGLSLNLHTMPQTIAGHWGKWLILGFLILGIFALATFVFYTLMQ